MSRPSFDEMGMETAMLWSRRSMDSKHRVGACILSNDGHTVVSVGYNGRFPGAETEERVSSEVGRSEYIHAEINALLRARWEHGEQHTLYCTHEPCHNCALAILAARHVIRVVYDTPYEGDGTFRRGSEILTEAGVAVFRFGNPVRLFTPEMLGPDATVQRFRLRDGELANTVMITGSITGMATGDLFELDGEPFRVSSREWNFESGRFMYTLWQITIPNFLPDFKRQKKEQWVS